MSTDKERDAYWELITKPLCRPSIKSRQQYDELVQSSSKEASTYLASSPHPLRSTQTLQGVHHSLFREVYEWAGDFREEKHVVAFGLPVGSDPYKKEFSGAHAPMIEEELGRLSQQLNKLLNAGDGPEPIAQAVAYYSTKLHLIHPFRDGNSRVAMVVTRFLAKRLLPEIPSPTPTVERYYQTRTLAQREAFLRPFAQHLLGVRLPERLSHSPHKMDFASHTVTLPLPDNLYASVACQDASDTRHWKRTLVQLRDSGKLASATPGSLKLIDLKGDLQPETSSSVPGTKPLLVHKTLEERERLLNGHSVRPRM